MQTKVQTAVHCVRGSQSQCGAGGLFVSPTAVGKKLFRWHKVLVFGQSGLLFVNCLNCKFCKGYRRPPTTLKILCFTCLVIKFDKYYVSCPQIPQDKTWKIVDGLTINEFSRAKMDATAAELVEEKDTSVEFLSAWLKPQNLDSQKPPDPRLWSAPWDFVCVTVCVCAKVRVWVIVNYIYIDISSVTQMEQVHIENLGGMFLQLRTMH